MDELLNRGLMPPPEVVEAAATVVAWFRRNYVLHGMVCGLEWRAFPADQPSAGRTLAEVRDSLPDDRREAIEARTRELIADKGSAT